MEIKQTENGEESNKYFYVYGITANECINLKTEGLKDQPISKIKFKDISVLISPFPTLYPMVNEEEAMQHANILMEMAKIATIIPMSYGTVFKNQKILETVLRKAYPTVKRTLKIIENKIELGLKVVKKQREEEYNGEAEKILESLNSVSVKSIAGDKFSDLLLLNHSFLVEKGKFKEFSEKIAELEKGYSTLKFLYTGPWPPYSFVNIKIGGSS